MTMSNRPSAYKINEQEPQVARRKSSFKESNRSESSNIAKISNEVRKKSSEKQGKVCISQDHKTQVTNSKDIPLFRSQNYSKRTHQEHTPLRLSAPVSLYADDSPAALVPYKLRLAFHHESQLEKLRAKVPITKFALPENSLPRWGEWSLDQKIPLLPVASNTIILSRGRLGQPLHKKGRNFSLRHLTCLDEIGLRESYNSLHDPHASSYLLQPNVQKILLRQGLISEDGKVLCGLKEFNNYRKYLKTFSDQFLDNYIKKDDMQFQNELNIKRKLQEYAVQKRLGATRLVDRRCRALEHQRMLHHRRMDEYVYKQEKRDAASHQAWGLKMQKKLEALMVATARTERHKEVIQRARIEQQDRVNMIKSYVTLKEELVQRRLEMNQLEKHEAQCLYANAWLSRKFLQEERQVQIEADSRKALQDNFEARAEKRLNKALQTCKPTGRKSKMKLQKAVDRIGFLQAKYFKLWRNKVMERRSANLCPYSRSVWNPIYHLRGTLQYLKGESGQRHVSSVVFDVIENSKKVPNGKPDNHEADTDLKAQKSLLSMHRKYTSGSTGSHQQATEHSIMTREFRRKELNKVAASLVGMHRGFLSKYKTRKRSRYSLLGALRSSSRRATSVRKTTSATMRSIRSFIALRKY